MRFAAMQDPCDDWLVMDVRARVPAEIGGRLLIGLTKREAEQLSAHANARHAGQRQSHRPG